NRRAVDRDTTGTGETGHVVDGRRARRSDAEHGAERRVRDVVHRRVFHAVGDQRASAVLAAAARHVAGQEAEAVVGFAAASATAAIAIRDAAALRVTRRDRARRRDRALRALALAVAEIAAIER